MDIPITQIKERKVLILLDDYRAPYDTCIVAEATDASFSVLNEIVSLTSGMLRVALDKHQIEKLMLKPMQINQELQNQQHNDFVSVDAREGISTGISIADRLKAIRHLADKDPDPRQLVSPGHIVPVQISKGGLIVKHAMPEAAYDIINLAFETNGALFGDFLNEKGELFEKEELITFASKHNIPIISLNELTRELLKKKQLVNRVASAELPSTLAGICTGHMYTVDDQDGEHLALVKGDISPDSIVTVRVHVASTFEDIFGNGGESSRSKLKQGLSFLRNEEQGIFLYLRLEKEYAEQKSNKHARMRNFGIGAQILRNLGAQKIRVLSNHQTPLIGLEAFGIEIIENLPMNSEEVFV